MSAEQVVDPTKQTAVSEEAIQLPENPTIQQWKEWFEARVEARAKKVQKEVDDLERSQHHPQGWNPMFDAPGQCGLNH